MEINALAVAGMAGLVTVIGVLANISQIVEFLGKIFAAVFKRNKKSNNHDVESAKRQTVINNLPTSGTIVGRNRIIERLRKSINENTMTMLVGQGGIGKSALLLETIKRYFIAPKKSQSDIRFDVIIWISSKDEELTFDKFLNTIARLLDYTGILQIEDVSKKAEEVNHLFLKYKILLLLDNCETNVDAEVFNFVERLYDNDRVVLTSRRKLKLGFQCHCIDVDPLSKKDAFRLMTRECKTRGLSYSEKENFEIFERIYDVTGGIPLAIKWVIGQADICTVPLTSVLDALQNGEGDIFGKMFESAWQILDNDSRDVMYALLFFTTPTTRGCLRQIGLVDEKVYDMLLGKLLGLSLIETDTANMSDVQALGLHPLTRFFLQKQYELSQREDLIYGRILKYYADYCAHYGNVGSVESFDELEREHANILKIFEWARSGNNPEHLRLAVSVANDISVFLWSRGYWSGRIEMSGNAASICDRLGDYKSALRHIYYQGIVYFWQGNLVRANDCLRECKKILMYCNDDVCCKSLIERLEALIGMHSEQWRASIDIFEGILERLNTDVMTEREIALFADWRVDNPRGYDSGRVALMQECGITLNRHGEYAKALEWLTKSLRLAESISDTEGQAVSYSHMANAHLGLGDYKSCQTVCAIGLKYAYSVRRKSTIARCHQYTCEAEYLRTGKLRSTKKHAEQAVLWFSKLGMSSELDRMRKIYNYKE